MLPLTFVAGLVACGDDADETASAQILIADPAHEFAPTAVGEVTSAFTTWVVNTDVSPVGPLAVKVTGDDADFVVDPACGDAFAASGDCALTVRFQPTRPGLRAAKVRIELDHGESLSMKLTGTGVAAQAITSEDPIQQRRTAQPSTAALAGFALTVVKDGVGTVTSGVGIHCGATCSVVVSAGTTVTLSASPATGHVFTSWAGCDLVLGSFCLVSMSSPRTVKAVFTPIPRTLTVTRTGAGTVTSFPAGIDCGGDCVQSYAHGTTVVLTAVPAPEHVVRWTGACAGSQGSCTVVMNGDIAAGVTFVKQVKLTIKPTASDSASGLVFPNIGAPCASGQECVYVVDDQSTVRLSAQPGACSQVGPWGGACSGPGFTCLAFVNGPTTVDKLFTRIPDCH